MPAASCGPKRGSRGSRKPAQSRRSTGLRDGDGWCVRVMDDVGRRRKRSTGMPRLLPRG